MNKIVMTTNLKRANKIASETIAANEMAVFSGKAGIGKTTFRELLEERLLEDKVKGEDKYILSYYVPFRKAFTQTNAILKEVYSNVFPNQKIPANENKKLRDLKRALSNSQQKLVLFIDNMQNLDLQTIKEIKIVHEEIKHLSILFFLMDDTKVRELLENPEVGYRVNRYNWKQLSEEETIKIAEEIYGLKFSSDIVRSKFVKAIDNTPLEIKNISKHLHKLEEFNGMITLSILSTIQLKAALQIKREEGISNRDIVEQLRAEGKEASLGYVTEVLNGKRSLDSIPSKGTATPLEVMAAIKNRANNRG